MALTLVYACFAMYTVRMRRSYVTWATCHAQVAQAVWSETFKYLADQKVMLEGILLKPSMVTPAAGSKKRASPDEVADYTLKLLKRRVPCAIPGTFREAQLGWVSLRFQSSSTIAVLSEHGWHIDGTSMISNIHTPMPLPLVAFDMQFSRLNGRSGAHITGILA